MAEYSYPNDGKLHTRFSELVRVTDGQLNRLVRERYGEINGYSSGATGFGSVQHERLGKYLKEKKEIPSVFMDKLPDVKLEVNPDWVEKHLAVEMFPGVVIHGTPDAFGKDWIIDFKTTSRGAKAYSSSKQVFFYAWLLKAYGLEIKNVYYLCQLWNEDRNEILDHECVGKEVTPDLISGVHLWTKDRCDKLKAAIEAYEPVEIAI